MRIYRPDWLKNMSVPINPVMKSFLATSPFCQISYQDNIFTTTYTDDEVITC